MKYQVTDELASYASPTMATIGGRRWGSSSPAAAWSASIPAAAKWISNSPGAKRLYSVNAATPVVVGDTVFISESYEIGGALLRAKPGGYDIVWKDPAGIRDPKAMRLALEHADRLGRLSLRLLGRKQRRRRIAVHRPGDRQSEMERAGPGSRVADVCRWAPCLPDGKRPRPLLRATPEKYDAVASFVPKNKEKDAEPAAGESAPTC